MATTTKQLLKTISEEFARGNLKFSAAYLAENIQWNILGTSTIRGKQQVLEVSKMLQLEAFPVITIKNVIAEGNCVVVESTGKPKLKMESLIIRPTVKFSTLVMKGFRK